MLRAIKLSAAISAAALIGSAAQAAQIKTVFNILLENHNFTQPSSDTAVQQLLGNPAAPFLNSLVTPGNPNAAMTSYATNYTNVGSIHPSEPNYVYAESGVTGPLNDADPYPNNIVNAANLSALLQSAGVPWKSYQEDIDLVPDGNSFDNIVRPANQWTPCSMRPPACFLASRAPPASCSGARC